MYAVADTHALIWYLLADPRLSPAARAAFATAVERGDPIGVPAICLVEIIYLVEKGRIPSNALTALEIELKTPGSVLTIVPLDQVLALDVQNVGRLEVPELPDRVIAATALHLGVPLISRDRKIQLSGIQTIW